MQRPVAMALALVAMVSHAHCEPAPTKEQLGDTSRRITQLGKLTTVSTVAKRTLTNAEVPFLGPPAGVSVWDVTFARTRLRFDSKEAGITDRYDRKFVATFDSEGKHLVMVRCRFEGVDPDLPKEPPPEAAEDLLRRS